MKKPFKIALLALIAILLTISGIVYRQHPIKVIPLYISLIVGLLQTNANRYSLLIGGFNSILYSIAYLIMGLYGNAAQAFFFSCLFQLGSFALWNKRKHGHSTRFRKLSWPARIIISIGFVGAFAVVALLLDKAGSAYQVLDSLSSLLGALITVLTMFAFIEYTWLLTPLCIITNIMYISLMREDMGNIIFLLHGIYSFFCVTQCFFSVQKLYAQQRKEDIEHER